MKLPKFSRLSAAAALVAAMSVPAVATAGAVFLTGHDPDFHAQDSVNAQHLLSAGLSFVTQEVLRTYDVLRVEVWVMTREEHGTGGGDGRNTHGRNQRGGGGQPGELG